MIIEKGYWNYYVAFRAKKIAFIHLIEELNDPKTGVIAVHTSDQIICNAKLNGILTKRKEEVQIARTQYPLSLDGNKLRELYSNNTLPEPFFDFDSRLNDKLDQAIADSIEKLQLYFDAYQGILSTSGNDKLTIISLMPIKLCVNNEETVFCPVYVYLFGTGNGVIKVEVPLKNVASETLAVVPMQRWFEDLKVWDSLFTPNGEDKYMLLTHDESVQDVMECLKAYVSTIFKGSIIEKERIIGVENFVIEICAVDRSGRVNENTTNEQLIRLACPELFGVDINHATMKERWKKQHIDCNGIHFLAGNRGRIISYGDAAYIASLHDREITCSDYLENSISCTFDPYIVIAMAKKDNEATIFNFINADPHATQHNLRHYYANANYLETMMVQSPTLGKKFYDMVVALLNEIPVDYNQLISNTERIDQINKSERMESQQQLMRIITCVFTVFFGLPLIHQTVSILKNSIFPTINIPFLSVSNTSIFLWIVVICYLIIQSNQISAKYWGHASILDRIRAHIVGYLRIYKNRKL